MKKTIKKIVVISLAILSAIALTACSSTKTTKKDELYTAITVDLTTLNSVRNATASEVGRFIYNTQEPLLRVDKDGKLQPAGAKEYKTTDGGKTWEFKLRDNMKWSNGEKVTANDYAFAVKQLKEDDKTEHPMFGKMIESAIAKDDITYIVTFVDPQPSGAAILAYTAYFPINEKFFNEVGGAEVYGLSISKTLYSGPYQMTRWSKSVEYKMEKNPYYYNKDNISINKVNIRYVTELSTMYQLFDSKRLDLVELKDDYIKKYEKEFTTEIPEGYVYSLHYGKKNKYMENINFRKAVQRAVNKDELTKNILKGGTPTDSMAPTDTFYLASGKQYHDVAPIDKLKKTSLYNPKEAQEYLDKSGLNGVKLDFLVSNAAENKKMAEYVKSQIEKNLKGVNVEIRAVESNTLKADRKSGSFDMLYQAWAPDYGEAVSSIETLEADNEFNYGKWDLPGVTSAISEGKKITDPAKQEERYRLFAQGEYAAIVEQAQIAPLYQRTLKIRTQPNIKDLHYGSQSSSYYFFEMKKE